MAEMKTFAFVVSFLLIYSAFLSTVPPGLLVDTYENPIIADVNPQLLVGFNESVQYNSTSYTGNYYGYELGGYEWASWESVTSYKMGVKAIVWAIWVSTALNDFVNEEGENRGTELTFVEMQEDSDNGTVRYDAVNRFVSSGVVFYWNTNDYTYAWEAWGNDSLQVIHGIGASAESPQNALSLVLGMLTFSIPGIPFLLQVLLSSPIYASILYLIWFFIKEVIPFL